MSWYFSRGCTQLAPQFLVFFPFPPFQIKEERCSFPTPWHLPRSAGALGCHQCTEVPSRGSGPGCPWVPVLVLSLSPLLSTGQGLSGCPGSPGPLRAPRAARSLLHLPSPSLFKSHRAHHASPVCQLSHSSNYALRLRRRSSSLSQHQTDTWEAASCPTAHTQPRPVPPHPHRAGLWQESSTEPCDTTKLSLNPRCGVGPS